MPNNNIPKVNLSGKDAKISNFTAGMMILTALLFDFIVAILNLLPVIGGLIGSAVNFFGYFSFIFWFLLLGVRLMTGRRISTMGVGFLIEMIPIINVLPGITASVALTIASTRVKLPANVSAVAPLKTRHSNLRKAA